MCRANYLMQVGQMLEHGNFSEAKRDAKKIKSLPPPANANFSSSPRGQG
jgi:hypothetical protein